MKSRIITLCLFGLTATVVAFYPVIKDGMAVTGQHNINQQQENQAAQTENAQKIEMVFALDTTGSMSGLIAAAKDKIWSIATNMAQAKNNPEIRIGLVAFRDRGDAYVTRVVDLSSDLDSVYSQLMDFQAGGGGDTPESVNQALHDAVHKINWSQEDNTYRVIFLVGDAPPHMDYPDDVKFPVSVQAAREKGIRVNAIQCGSDPMTTNRWQAIASLGQGDFFNVEQNGSAVAVTTPYDEKLANLSRKLDETRMYYGSREEMARKESKVAATEKVHREASVESRARRAMFNSSDSGKKNQIGDGDLVEDVTSGRVDLESVPAAKLPAPLRDMPAVEQEKIIRETEQKRQKLKAEILQLSEQRKKYVNDELKDRDNVSESLDNKLIGTLRKQASEKGLVYEEKAITY